MKTRRLISFLSALPAAPPGPGLLRVEHLMAFRAHRATTNAPTAWAEVKNFGHLAQLKPLRDMVSPDVLRYLTQRVEGQVPHRSRPGYSDGELRRVLRAARQDVAALSDRIGAGEFLLHRWRTAAEDLSSQDGVLGESLALMADGGDVVPMSFPGPGTPRSLGERSALACNLFLGRGDLTPFMVLLVAMSGRNIETIKELPALHIVLEGKAVQLQQVPPVVLQMLFGHVLEADRGTSGRCLRIKPGQEPVRPGEGVADRADAPRVFPGWQRAGQHRVAKFLGHKPVPDRDRGEVQLPGRAVLLEHCRCQRPAVMLEPCGQGQVGARS